VITLGGFFAALATTGWVGSTLLLVVYHRIARWWGHAYGRALFLLILVSFLFFTTSMLYNWFGPDHLGRTQLRVVMLVLSVGMVWYLLITLLRGGVAARRQRRWEERGTTYDSGAQ
jgi:hypothetical protein